MLNIVETCMSKLDVNFKKSFTKAIRKRKMNYETQGHMKSSLEYNS